MARVDLCCSLHHVPEDATHDDRSYVSDVLRKWAEDSFIVMSILLAGAMCSGIIQF